MAVHPTIHGVQICDVPLAAPSCCCRQRGLQWHGMLETAGMHARHARHSPLSSPPIPPRRPAVGHLLRGQAGLPPPDRHHRLLPREPLQSCIAVSASLPCCGLQERRRLQPPIRAHNQSRQPPPTLHPHLQPYRAQWYEFVKDCALFQWGASVSCCKPQRWPALAITGLRCCVCTVRSTHACAPFLYTTLTSCRCDGLSSLLLQGSSAEGEGESGSSSSSTSSSSSSSSTAAEGSAAAEGAAPTTTAAEGSAAAEGAAPSPPAVADANLGRRRVLLQEAEGEPCVLACPAALATCAHACLCLQPRHAAGSAARASCGAHCWGHCLTHSHLLLPRSCPPTRLGAAALGDGSVNVYNGCFPGFKDVEGEPARSEWHVQRTLRCMPGGCVMTVHAQLVSRPHGQRLRVPTCAPDAHLPSHLLPPPCPAEFEDYMDGKYQFETDSAAVGITLRCLVGATTLCLHTVQGCLQRGRGCFALVKGCAACCSCVACQLQAVVAWAAACRERPRN